MKEVRMIVREIHETSYVAALDLGIKRGLSPNEVAKHVVSPMFGYMSEDPNAAWGEMRQLCEGPYLSSPTKAMMHRRNSRSK